MKALIVVAVAVAVLAVIYFIGIPLFKQTNTTPMQETSSSSESVMPSSAANPRAMIATSMGTFEVELYQDDAPKTVANFIALAKKKFYDNLIFHRVVKGFVIQGGDPKGDGSGGPGYTFQDELNPAAPSYQAGYKKGVLAMANRGPNTNGSQWFVTLADLKDLPRNYTIFGKVISGQNVADAIGLVPVGQSDRPLSPVVIKTITINVPAAGR